MGRRIINELVSMRIGASRNTDRFQFTVVAIRRIESIILCGIGHSIIQTVPSVVINVINLKAVAAGLVAIEITVIRQRKLDIILAGIRAGGHIGHDAVGIQRRVVVPRITHGTRPQTEQHHRRRLVDYDSRGLGGAAHRRGDDIGARRFCAECCGIGRRGGLAIARRAADRQVIGRGDGGTVLCDRIDDIAGLVGVRRGQGDRVADTHAGRTCRSGRSRQRIQHRITVLCKGNTDVLDRIGCIRAADYRKGIVAVSIGTGETDAVIGNGADVIALVWGRMEFEGRGTRRVEGGVGACADRTGLRNHTGGTGGGRLVVFNRNRTVRADGHLLTAVEVVALIGASVGCIYA